MAKSKGKAGSRGAGNIRSAGSSKSARPWTAQEMGAAAPLPMPETDSATAKPTSGVPHVGKGQTTPGGAPEDRKPKG